MCLMAGIDPNVDIDARTKKPKNLEWKTALRLMKNPEDFKKKLISFKDLIDSNSIPQ